MNNKTQFVGKSNRVKVPLCCLGKILTGNTPSKKNSEFWDAKDIPFIKPSDMDDAEVTLLRGGSEFVSERARGKARIAGPGSVLVSCIGTIGKIAVVEENEVAFNQQINCITAEEADINPYYLAYALQANRGKLGTVANAPVVPIINKSQFESFCLWIDKNVEHQQEIVIVLDAIRDQQIALNRIIDKLDQLVKSRFVEMFGDPVDGAKWERKSLSSLYEVKSSKRIYARDQTKSGVPFLRLADIGSLIDFGRHSSDLFILEERYEELSVNGQVPTSGDVLVTARGTLGRCYEIKDSDRFYFQDGMISWLAATIASPSTYYLLAVFENDHFIDALNRGCSGTTVKYLSISDLANLKIPLPSVELQQQFAAFVAQVDKTRSIAQQQIEKLQTLYDSLAQDYFGY